MRAKLRLVQMPKPLFEEKQRWPWIPAVVVFITSILGWWALLSTALGVVPEPRARWVNWTDSPLEAVLVWLAVGVALPIIFLIPVYVAVHRDSVQVRAAFLRRNIPLRE